MMKEKLLISACLLGSPCRYDGGAKGVSQVETLRERFALVPVCPEVLGGLPIPRSPAERQGECIVNSEGRDVTREYRLGAEKALAIARENGCVRAVLKERSPSCGHGTIYDGTFTGTLTAGDGVTARLMRQNGIAVYGESELDALLGEAER